jgi:hypothetical protein
MEAYYIIQRIFGVWIALAIFGIFDYIGYNYALQHGNPIAFKIFGKEVTFYRVTQTGLQILISLILWWIIDFTTACGFLLLWWVFIADFMYYGICELEWFKLNEMYPGKGGLKNDDKNGITWAWWTPIGLVYLLINKGVKKPISTIVLLIQALAGIYLWIIWFIK